jgi:putative ABC transport system ATP-binding protein
VIQLDAVSKTYRQGQSEVRALDRISLVVPTGQHLSIVGPSGSGKSTLLHIIAGTDAPTSGEVVIDGSRQSAMSDDETTLFRRRKIGFVFQFFNLLPTLSAEENVALPLLLDGQRLSAVQPRVREMLSLVGLEDRRTHRPSQLSGGEMQRVAIARALITRPLLLLADEPTGNLDTRAGEQILALIREATDRLGQTVMLVTHDPRVAAYGDRTVTIRDGRLASDHSNSEATPAPAPSAG